MVNRIVAPVVDDSIKMDWLPVCESSSNLMDGSDACSISAGAGISAGVIIAGVGSGEDSGEAEVDGGSVGGTGCWVDVGDSVATGAGSAAQPAINIKVTTKTAALNNDFDDGGAILKLIGA